MHQAMFNPNTRAPMMNALRQECGCGMPPLPLLDPSWLFWPRMLGTILMTTIVAKLGMVETPWQQKGVWVVSRALCLSGRKQPHVGD